MAVTIDLPSVSSESERLILDSRRLRALAKVRFGVTLVAFGFGLSYRLSL